MIRLLRIAENEYVFRCQDCSWESEKMSRFVAYALQIPVHECENAPMTLVGHEKSAG